MTLFASLRRGLLVAVLALFAPLAAHAQLTTIGAGPGGIVAVGGGGGYTGPGDVVASAKVWLGLRAYSSAQTAGSTKAIKVFRTTDSQLCDVLLNTSGTLGNVTSCSGAGSGSVATFCTTNCDIDLFYDQTGNGFNFQASGAHRAHLVFSCLGALPCADFATGLGWYQTTISATADGLTVSAVAIRTGAFTAQNDLFSRGAATFYNNAANQVGGYFGNLATATASDSAWHAIQIVAQNTSSAIAVDATKTTGLNLGNVGMLTDFWLGTEASSGTNPLNGKIAEIGMWPVAFSSGQQTTVCHNQFTYWGTPTSC